MIMDTWDITFPMNPDICMYSELIWWLGAKPAPGHHLDTWAMQEVWVKGK